jgi:hypothetical protein
VSLVANPRPPYAAADRFMLTTILAYVIAALASQRSWLALGAPLCWQFRTSGITLSGTTQSQLQCWLEASTVDSYLCHDLGQAEAVLEYLVSSARDLSQLPI